MPTLLELRNVSKSFGGLRAVDGVNTRVERRSVVGLIGPNGSGKTTLLNVVSGIYRPDSGEVYFEGRRVDGLPPHKLYELGIVKSFQIPKLFQKMTVLDNLVIASRGQVGDGLLNVFFKRRVWRRQERELAAKALNLLSFFGLGGVEHSYPTILSGGQLKLLELGKVLRTEPKLLLLDEPTAGVNPVLAKEIFDKILSLRDEAGLTFIVVEHRVELLLEYVDRLLVMDKGRLIADGPPEEVVRDEKVINVYLGE